MYTVTFIHQMTEKKKKPPFLFGLPQLTIYNLKKFQKKEENVTDTCVTQELSMPWRSFWCLKVRNLSRSLSHSFAQQARNHRVPVASKRVLADYENAHYLKGGQSPRSLMANGKATTTDVGSTTRALRSQLPDVCSTVQMCPYGGSHSGSKD